MNQFIVFEGVDGSGKTTQAKQLADDIGAEYVKTPGEDFRAIRRYIDQEAPPEARLLFYLSSVVDASNRIRGVLAERSVVCDRYIWSTLIPHSAYYNQPLEGLEASLKSAIDGLVQPDQTFLLQVNEVEQLQRLGIRPTLSVSDNFCKNRQVRRRVSNLYDFVAEREGFGGIDTTQKSVPVTMEEIHSHLPQLVQRGERYAV